MNVRSMKVMLVLALFSAYPALSQSVMDQYEKAMVLKNNIRKKVEFAQGASGPYKSLEVVYNNMGLVLEEASYRANGKITIKRSYKYDARGNMTEYTNLDGNRNKVSYQRLVRYTDNRKTQEVGFDGVDKFENRFRYDARGNLQEIRYMVSNNLVERREITYSGNRQEITVYKADNSVVEKVVLVHDNKNRLLEDILLSSTGAEKRKNVFTYAPSGNILSETKYYSGKMTEKITYEYRGDQLIRIYKEEPGTARYLDREYQYDVAGRVTGEKWFEKATNNYSTRAYRYDARNNVSEVTSFYAAYNFSETVKINYEYF